MRLIDKIKSAKLLVRMSQGKKAKNALTFRASVLKGTREAEINLKMKKAYNRIFVEQKKWYKKTAFSCPQGCGCCCHNFEPDLLESETIFMAIWLLENQKEVADKIADGIFPFENGKTCPFYNDSNPFHCSIYEGRPSICRLFGASGFKSKTGNLIFKPCKFYPLSELQKHKPPLDHRQYSTEEVKSIFGKFPPAMSDMMEKILLLNPENQKTELLRNTLPQMIRKIKWISTLNES